MVGEGISIRRIDAIAKDFGMAVDSGHPMGPLELLDLIGLPVAMHVLTSLAVLGSRIESRDALLRNFLPEKKPPLTFWKSGKENPQALDMRSRTIVAHVLQKLVPSPTTSFTNACFSDGRRGGALSARQDCGASLAG